MNKKFKIFAIILSLGFLAAGYLFFFVLNKDHPDFKNIDADYIIEASILYHEFSSDPKKAQLKYGGKMIHITGKIDEIEKRDSLTIAVYVFSEGLFGDEGIRCTFLKSDAKMIQDVNDVTAIKGFCSGYNETDVILEKCSMIN